MNHAQKALIKSTWQRVVPIADEAASLFYRRLFEIDPGLARHFAAVDMRVQRNHLVKALSAVVGGLDDVDSLLPQLEALGRRHAGYGATAQAYETVGDALLWTLGQGLGDAWSPAAETAWCEAYALLSAVMQRAPQDDPIAADIRRAVPADDYCPRGESRPGYPV